MESPLHIQDKSIINDKIGIDTANIYTKLKSYDDAYYSYLNCLEQHPKIQDKEANQILRDPSLNYVYSGIDCIPPDSTTLFNEIDKLQRDMVSISKDDTDTSYNQIRDKYQQLVHIRNELDMKLNNLYNIKSSIPMEIQKETDSTLYATIAWTVLATCVIYMIFTVEGVTEII
mgnify:CR=1 FL=1